MNKKFFFVFFFVFLICFPVIAKTREHQTTITTLYITANSYKEAQATCKKLFKKDGGTNKNDVTTSRTNNLNEYTCRYTLEKTKND